MSPHNLGHASNHDDLNEYFFEQKKKKCSANQIAALDKVLKVRYTRANSD